MALPYPDNDIQAGTTRRKVYEIKPENWNKLFPYSFTVVNAPDNSTVPVSSLNTNLNFEEFILPINPQNLSISTAFSIRTSATNKGIVEEHNGTIFRTIVISGTFGIAPTSRAIEGGQMRSNLRPVQASALTNVVRAIGAISPNAVGAANAISANINRTIAAAGKLPDLVSGIDPAPERLEQLGFAMMNKFINYLVAYSEFKKQPGNEGARLVFVNRKDNVSYVVTPQTIDTTKAAADPHITRYRIVLRGWDLATDVPQDVIEPLKIERDINVLSSLYNSVREARGVLSAANATLRGVVQDFDTNFKLVQQVAFVIKDAIGLTKTAADFDEIVQNKWTEITQRFDKIGDQIKDTATESSGVASNNIVKSFEKLDETIKSSGKFTATNPQGLPDASLNTELNALNQQQRDKFNPIKTARDRITHVDFLDTIPITSLQLSAQDIRFIESKTNENRRLTIADFDNIRSNIEELRTAYEDYLGLGDATVNAAFNRTAGVQQRDPETSDFLVIKSLNDIVASVDALASKNDVITHRQIDPFIRTQINGNNPKLTIKRFNNGFPVPFPAGSTLEKLAFIYFADPDKWIEIAVSNGLKPPYIDEVGFIRSFTSSGTDNVFTLNDVTDVFINQEVFLSSTGQLSNRRRIVSIKELTPTSFLIEVDGDSDLSLFTTAQNAQMKAFLPNTVNSNKIINIPTLQSIPEPNAAIPKTRKIPATINLNRQQRAMGVDIALTDDFDIAFTNSGDIKIASGLANAIQAVKLKIGYEKGTLNRHPEVGLGLKIGERNALSAGEIRTLLENAILGDRRFKDVPEINIEFDGPIVRINLRVEVADGGDVIPLSFTLNTE